MSPLKLRENFVNKFVNDKKNINNGFIIKPMKLKLSKMLMMHWLIYKMPLITKQRLKMELPGKAINIVQKILDFNKQKDVKSSKC